MKYDLRTELHARFKSAELAEFVYDFLKEYSSINDVIKFNKEEDILTFKNNIFMCPIVLEGEIDDRKELNIRYYYLYTGRGTTTITITNNYCEIGITSTDGYYAKRIDNDENPIVKYIYFDNTAINYLYNKCGYSGHFYSENVKEFGIIPDFEYEEYLDDNKNYFERTKLMVEEYKNNKDIVSEVNSKRNPLRLV